MSPLVLLGIKLAASLFAVLGLGWLARLLGLGEDARLTDAAHALRIADEGQYGFAGVDAAIDRAGYSALVKDAKNRHVLIQSKGGHFVTRSLQPPIAGRLDQKLLTIDLQQPDFEPVTLNLGEKAQYWASGLRHIPNG
jgi:hypothetical protein